MKEYPKVGVGVIICNKEGKILVGKRIGSFAQKYSIPGGIPDLGEQFEDTAIREVKEETDLDIVNPEVIAVTNNLQTFKEEGIHFVSIVLLAKEFSGKPKIMEPNKCREWRWVDPKNLPQPHFDASNYAVQCYLDSVIYKKPHV
jgi:8-oxo-dGTP diphosphatase